MHEDCYHRTCAIIGLVRAFSGATKCMEMLMSHCGIDDLLWGSIDDELLRLQPVISSHRFSLDGMVRDGFKQIEHSSH